MVYLRNSAYVPDWCAVACTLVDLGLGAYVVARVPAYQSASHITMIDRLEED